MFSWTEKVSGKISRLRSDSESSHSNESGVVRPEFQDVPLTAKNSSSRASKLSSYLHSLIPTTLAGVDTQKFSNIRNMPLPSLPSLPKRWRGHGFSWAQEQLNQLTYEEPDHALVEASPSSGSEKMFERFTAEEASPSRGSEKIFERFTAEEASPSHGSEKFSADVVVEAVSHSHGARSFASAIEEESSFISVPLFEFLESSLPNLVKGCQWISIYSTLKHGISLRTLFRRSSDITGPCLLIVGDMQGAVFGGLLEAPLKPSSRRKYQGNFQTFVFTTKYGDPRLFRPTGENRYYYLCMDDLLAFGGGGNFALCLDEDLFGVSPIPCAVPSTVEVSTEEQSDPQDPQKEPLPSIPTHS